MLKKSFAAMGIAALAGVGAAATLPTAIAADLKPAGEIIQLASCNPCAAKKAKNPCNPCAAKKASACNPCNPCAAKKK
ncbi:MAG: hypothetical protein HOH04_08665 [Rhodospirillaceae bacterium]|nr:hypothetical protein [Rhodospirillaceae bacterium]